MATKGIWRSPPKNMRSDSEIRDKSMSFDKALHRLVNTSPKHKKGGEASRPRRKSGSKS